jgi:hypothetical protein
MNRTVVKRGLAHSGTLARGSEQRTFRQILSCDDFTGAKEEKIFFARIGWIAGDLAGGATFHGEGPSAFAACRRDKKSAIQLTVVSVPISFSLSPSFCGFCYSMAVKCCGCWFRFLSFAFHGGE